MEQGPVRTGAAVQKGELLQLSDERQIRLGHAGQDQLLHAPVHRPEGKHEPGVLRWRGGRLRRGGRRDDGGLGQNRLSGHGWLAALAPAQHEQQHPQQRDGQPQQRTQKDDPFFIHTRPFLPCGNFSVYQYSKPVPR